MIPSRPSVRFSRAPWVNNSTRATTQVPQAVEIRALTHPLKNLRTFSDGTVRWNMMNDNDFTGRIFKRIRRWYVILRYTCFLKLDLKPDNLSKKSRNQEQLILRTSSGIFSWNTIRRAWINHILDSLVKCLRITLGGVLIVLTSRVLS